MPKLPTLSGKEVIKILEKRGFTIVRTRGSHIILRRDALTVVVPLHDELAPGTLLSILRQANMTKEELLRSL